MRYDGMTRIEEVREWLDDRLPQANQEAAESHKVAMNSYGAGYDCGYRDALKEVLNLINGEPE
jgi:hypothetical protein